LRISAEFVTSAADAAGLPRGLLVEVALVGRSNVGKSSLINALTRRRLARTSAAPGKTRLANLYRVARGGGRPFHLVDLPGYGYARGGAGAAREFEELTRSYFSRPRGLRFQPEHESRRRRLQPERGVGDAEIRLKADPTEAREGAETIAALLLVDARHPGLASDLAAWKWLEQQVADRAVVVTKIDKLPRGQRIRAAREFESVFEHSVLPVSAVTGEGLDELWNLIDTLTTSSRPQPRRSRSSPQPLPKATALRPPSQVEGPSRVERPKK
jgi:GTP-binding protein